MKFALLLLFAASTARAQRDWGPPANHDDAATLYPKFGKTAIVAIAHLPDGRYAYMVDNRSCTVFSRKAPKTREGKYFFILADGATRPDTERSGCASQQEDGTWVNHTILGNVLTPDANINWQRAPLSLDRVVYDNKKGQQ